MNNLVYLVYGADQYIRESLFSMLSALRFAPSQTANCRIVIYTDNPRPFTRLGATVECLDEKRLREWDGPANFMHRRKIFALWHSIQNYGPSVLLDGDTYFLKPPRKIFERIKPGHALMHLCEGRFGRFRHPYLASLCQSLYDTPLRVHDQLYEFTPRSHMWNAGVVGLHPTDEHVMEQVVELADAVYRRSSSVLSEQVAFSQVLERASRLHESQDVVFHYWLNHLRTSFQENLTTLLTDTRDGMTEELFYKLYSLRPQALSPAGMKARGKARAKSILFRAGWTGVGLRSSAGWFE